MITNVLVANRGEIARRVFATARRMGLATTAVFSDPDANAPHVTEADAAVRLPGATPAQTYLNAGAIIAAARAAGADAVHPGYGFLAENAGFARAVTAAGLCWIGPPAEAIASMGSKIEARKLMNAAGVPVLPELDPDTVTQAELPVLIKASAGGGGRGMRIVRSLDELPAQLAAARREAAAAFGDPTVFCERYLGKGRHIEVQIMADRHGTIWVLGERECSIQRRHQKVIEEAPSPLVERTAGLRERLFEAARLAVAKIGYEGAGTVEFISQDGQDFYFLEMNTRLQVEHPVTEHTTGLDLVRLQLQVADGCPLPAEPPPTRGHSIEARLYAEDPARDWQPQSGILRRIGFPGAPASFAVLTEPGVRVDSGVTSGSSVSTHYDPMLAKVISYAGTRTEAAHMLATALTRAKIHGLVTNRDLLVQVLRDEAFLAGDTDTAFLDRSHPDTDDQAAPAALAAVAAALAEAAANRKAATVNAGLPAGWRNLPSQPQSKTYTTSDGNDIEVRYHSTHVEYEGVTPVAVAPDHVVLDIGGVRRPFDIARYGDLVCVDSPLGSVQLTRRPRFADPAAQVPAGSLLAPMPGSVIRLGASPGDRVTKGQPILWLEAMKMEHVVLAPADGVLTELNVTTGQQIDTGAVLAVVDTEGSP
ncbi:MAG TPA: biotin carboxylase N-terminal domain-containing protein [Streptosporangiaceae bacterium]|nr:biotin carboxylase N-terminal domain-containing protein [Streptosporangiaceae bacterium]